MAAEQHIYGSQLHKQTKALLLHALFLFFVSPLVWAQSSDKSPVTWSDLQALRDLKLEFIDLTGALQSWNDTGACSGSWVGIKCSRGQVVSIQLPWRGLAGRISEKIGQLRALRIISLHDNVLSGAIPVSLGSLPSLVALFLFNNRLSGSIPASMGHLSRLKTLDFSNNLLTGEVSELTNAPAKITKLNLSFNSLSGPIPASFSQSSSLVFLALQHNFFSGSVPFGWSNQSRLEELSLGNNNLNGTIPVELGTLWRLRTLDLSNNGVDGTIPTTIFNASSIVSLNLEGNRIDGLIPETVSQLHNLSVLNLRNNQLKGSIPANIGYISGITTLDLSGNDLDGKIPDSVADLPNLISFNVSHNNLSGAVPALLSKKFNSTSFVGNIQLCGYSVATLCPSSPPPSNSPSPSSPENGLRLSRRHKPSIKGVILIAAGVVLLAALLVIVCCIPLGRRVRKRAALKAKAGGGGGEKKGFADGGGGEAGGKLVHFSGRLAFTADDLLCATAEILGKSPYGTAYKATLEGGTQVAVKRLREKIAKREKEFEVEAGALGRMRHPNLLALRAYYLGPKGERLLVFDFMPKGSLASFLHASGVEAAIDWTARMKIAVGVARGLCYLHVEKNVAHGNLTSSNVLLDEHANAKIADAGVSRLMTGGGASNVVEMAGTQGYRAPELSNKADTRAADVYSLGVILLELLTGKSPGEEVNGVELPEWAASMAKEEQADDVFDSVLARDGPVTGDELLNVLNLALHCVASSPGARPGTQEVVRRMEEIKPEIAANCGDDENTITLASE